MAATKITIWNEFIHEVEHEAVKKVYPDGIHKAIAKGIAQYGDFDIKTATLQEPEHGLSEEVLSSTDTLIWWAHMAHDKVNDEIVDRVQRHVLNGMGLIVLHSGHFSKIFKRLLGTHASLKWREADEKERLWNLEPSHPIMAGIPDYFELAEEEM
ncbi:MAG: ThuA domain-containing protein, partial [Trueperaceae bacterium]|nr:ThuA domain-containing protein [Trueperaceae bacterium]